ncbi:MAG: glycine oxidase ThiO [Planctomycetales bacterium]|nr:glycine oxidase ThiO [Planctomycetales bacterium]
MYDCVILGGGIMGLSLAYELAQRDKKVVVVDHREIGRQTSWAASGIIPATSVERAPDPYAKLCGISARLYPEWTARLTQESGISPEYEAVGGIHVARSAGELISLEFNVQQMRDDGIEIERLSLEALHEYEPALAATLGTNGVTAAYWVPDEAQIRPPRLMKSLRAACASRGVTLWGETEVLEFVREEQRLTAVMTSRGELRSDAFCVTAGAWTDDLLRPLHVALDIQPWRGQLVLLAARPGLLRHVVNEGPNYILQRRDGQVIVGSTMEEVGYDERTDASIEQLRAYAGKMIGQLAGAEMLHCWAGLRPHSNDGFPYVGSVPGFDNCFVAAGHHRAGITLAPGTARVLTQLILNEATDVDMLPFQLSR